MSWRASTGPQAWRAWVNALVSDATYGAHVNERGDGAVECEPDVTETSRFGLVMRSRAARS